MMRRHFLKIPDSIQAWYPGGAPANWKVRAFEDATEKGTRLTLLTLPPNERGPRAALFGDTYYFEVGQDRGRTDTLFLMRIEPAKSPNRVPHPLDCEIRLWPGGLPAILDPVEDLLTDEDTPREAREDVRPEAWSMQPIPALLRMLAQVPAELRAQLRPAILQSSPLECLSSLRILWERHRLDRSIEPAGRQVALLRGIIKPQNLPEAELDGLLELFGIALLNKLAVPGAEGQGELERVLRGLAEVSDSSTRLGVWTAMTAGLCAADIRRELYECRTGLESLSGEGVRVATACRNFVVPVLLASARERRDVALVGVLEGSHPGAQVLGAIARWADGLEFGKEETPEAAKSGLEVTATAAAQPVQAVVPVPEEVAAIDVWVLRLRGLGRDQVQREAEQIRIVIEECVTGLTPPNTLQGFSTFLSRIAGLRGAAAEWLERLPNPEELVRDREEADTAFSAARDVLGGAAADLIGGASVTPGELREVIAILRRADLVARVPAWMWAIPAGDASADPPREPVELAHALLDARTRAAVRHFVDFVDRLGQPAAASWLPPLPLGRPVEEHLGEWFDKAREFLLEVPTEVQQMLCRDSEPIADLNLLLANAALVGQLRDVLGEALMAEVMKHVAGLSSAQIAAELQAVSAAVQFFRTYVGGLEGISFAAILARAAKERAVAPPEEKGQPVAERRVRVDHNWTDSTGSRAALTAVRGPEDAPYVQIAAPLVLEAAQPETMTVRIDWSVKGKLREAWPVDWPDVEPSGTIVVYPHDWRPNPNDSGYLHSFAASFPVRLPRGERLRRLEVEATVMDPATGRAISDLKVLRWDQIEEHQAILAVEWADATDPDYIKQHPIGPQEKAATLLQRMQAGSSSAVIAPRRFGKSTLAEYLVREGPSVELAIPPAIWCTQFWSTGGFDHQRLWDHASGLLKDLLGAEIGTGRHGPLPGPEAFDHVRRVAKEQGFKAVVLVLDEAQLFFSSVAGFEHGSALKMLLERHWARAERGMVPLLFTMIGLPSLRYRVGADLMGLLNPIERSTMDEAELRPLIAHIAKGLQTTREARARLASTAGNLFLLRALLDRLTAHLRREKRTWAAYSDIYHVEESLRRDLQRALPESEHVAAYVRDVLNDAERVEDWRPITAYPVAVALAQERQAGGTFGEVVEQVAGVLNQWCAGVADEHVRPTYDASTVTDLVGHLRERGVLREEEFASRLLEAWLRGAGTRIRAGLDEPFREALVKGAQRRIKIPEGVQRTAFGAEAEIVRHEGLAFRVRPVATEADRRRYLETVRVMETLKDAVGNREAGSDHIFDPISIGLSSRNTSEAVQVYKWVDGEDLSNRKAAMSPESVVDVGIKLGRALTLLHRYNILHRDICPKNIILAESGTESLHPVLIDFGFARVAEGRSATAFAGEHFAPEVKTQPAFWSKAADVYGLASTLRWLLPASCTEPDLVTLLELALAERPEERGSAEQLVAALGSVGDRMRLDERQVEAWQDLQKTLRPEDRHSPWISKLMRENRSMLVSLWMGFNRDVFDQCRTCADFLNKVTESSPARFARLRDLEANLKGEPARAVAFVRALRHDRSHGIDAKYEDTRQLVAAFKGLPEDQQRKCVVSVAERVGRACKFPSLESITSKVLDRG